MLKPICGTCNIERRIGSHGGENGVEIVLMAGQRKYKAYSSDKWVCPICGNIEYHIARDTNPFWTEFSARPAPDFEDGAVPIWETIKDAQDDLKVQKEVVYVDPDTQERNEICQKEYLDKQITSIINDLTLSALQKASRIAECARRWGVIGEFFVRDDVERKED